MEEQKRIILNDNLRTLLFKFSAPAMVGMLVSALYNFVDTIFVGRGVGTDAIAGLTLILPIQIFIIAVGLLAGVGAASIISRSLGAGDMGTARKAAGNAVIINLILNIILIIPIIIFMDKILVFFGASEAVLPYAKDYLNIVVAGFIFFSFGITANNIIRAEGKPRAAMYVIITGALLNIVLDPIFIFVFGMGVKGVAIATVISQIAATVFILLYFKFGKSVLEPKFEMFKINWRIVKNILSIGFPSFIMETIGSILFLLFNRTVVNYGGDLYVSVVGITIRIMDLIFMPILGISHGFTTLSGFNYGAKIYQRVKRVLREAVIWSTLISGIGFLIMIIFPQFLLGIFTNDPEVINIGVEPMRIIATMFWAWGFFAVNSTFFQSIGKPKPALIMTLTRQIVFLIPLIIILPKVFGLTGLWIAWPITDMISLIIGLVFLFREIRIINRAIEVEV